MNALLQAISRTAAAAVLVAAGLMTGGASANETPAQPPFPGIPHCLAEDGGPQPVCIWDSAVDGDGTPAAPNNVVILFASRPGQDPIAHRIK